MERNVRADHTRSAVALAECGSYERARVDRAVQSLFENLDAEELLRRGPLVLLKPNLLSSRCGPDYPVNTHPEVVRAVARILRYDFGCRLLIGDSCGSLSAGSTDRAIQCSGVDGIAREVGAEIFNVDRRPARTCRIAPGRPWDAVRLPEVLREIDLLVSLPKLKTHGLTRYTGAVKNLFGLIPGQGKKDAHVAAPNPLDFAEMLADLAAAAWPQLAVLDAVVGMEGNGPNAGTVRPMGALAASRDAVALDALACDLIGYEPLSVPTLTACRARGLGAADPNRVDVLGCEAARFRTPDWAKPIGDKFDFFVRHLPGPLFGRLLDAMTAVHSTVREERCRLCGECVRNCPAGAMRTGDGKIIVAPELCIACYCCEEVCPHGAIEMRRTDFGRLISAVAGFFTGRR